MVSPFVRQCLVCLSVGSTTLGHGCTVAVPAVLLAQLHEMHGTPVTTDHISWASSILAPGFPVGAFLVSPVMGRLGRKTAHLLVTVPAILSWLMIAFADTFTLIMIGRALQGLSFGMMLPLRSTLIGEYTSPKYRGAFLSTITLAQGSGVLVVHFIGTYFHWRTTCFICCLFHIVSLVIIYFTPESPSWLANKEKFEKCIRAFKLLRGDDENKELDKLIGVKTTVSDTQKIKNISDVLRMIKKKEFYKPVVLMSHAYLSGEFSGSSIIAIYSTIVMSTVVSQKVDVQFWVLMLDINRTLTGIFMIYVARILRRKVLMVSSSGVCIGSYLVIVGNMYMRSFGILSDNVWVPLVLLNVLYMSTVMVLGTPYIIAGEIFPLQYRSIGSSISVLVVSAAFFAVVKTFPGLVSTIGLGCTYLIYAGVLTYVLIVTTLFLPETSGKTLLQIEEEIRRNTANETAANNEETLRSINPSVTLADLRCDHNIIEEDSRLRPKV